MNEAWAAVIAAVAGGVFGIAGTFAGISVGRRQTAYQADVEHGQWLRGQRQEAYVQFLEAWDLARDRIVGIVNNLDEHTRPENFDSEEEMVDNMDRMLEDAVDPVQKPYERVALISPAGMVSSADGMYGALQVVMDRVFFWARCPSTVDAIESSRLLYLNAKVKAQEARSVFFEQARSVLLEPPQPSRQR